MNEVPIPIRMYTIIQIVDVKFFERVPFSASHPDQEFAVTKTVRCMAWDPQELAEFLTELADVPGRKKSPPRGGGLTVDGEGM